MPANAPYSLIDLEHLDRPESVAACLLETGDGPVLVDPGPAVTLPKLSAGMAAGGHELADLSALLLTHIHLDHAGATGTLARAIPRLRVYVHDTGAPHLVDPEKLLSSASRLYGDRMQSLWGEVAAVPAHRVTALRGGEQLSLGGRIISVANTPGHAWHHLSYYEAASGVAFVGDTAGIRGPRLPVVLPVTPPPDFDLEAWLGSLELIRAWRPRQLVLTHYGPATNPDAHLEALAAGLRAWAGYAKESLALEGSDPERVRWFVQRLEEWIAEKVAPEQAKHFLEGAGPEACWQGLARYWRKR
jgi:glyoxylase-like metal-dependent hydrolase (beta-lactamase superfamily II)